MPRPLDESKLTPLGRRILALAKRRGYPTLRAAADGAEISYTQLLDVAYGRVSPSVDTLQRLVNALGGTLRLTID